MAGMEGVVGFNYTAAAQGVSDLNKQKGQMVNFISRLQALKAQNLQEWTGAEEETYQRLMADAKKGLTIINNNIASLSKWLNNASVAHSSTEKGNANLLANCYASATKV